MTEKQDTIYTSIRITKQLRDRLMKLGHKGQSYESIITALLPSEDLPEGRKRG